MCGIAGEIRFDRGEADAGAAAVMARSLARRGPDGVGVVARGRVAFAHRRLQIVDLSEAAQQPMVDSELGLTICYNGMIYNYQELRDELEAKGYRFFSTGDTEVLIKAYHAWGEKFVERLRGMFAIAILERESGRVVLARDRLGIKPLYYTESKDRFRFASSLPALLAAGEVDKSIDPVALHHYMTFHSVVPPPHTILNGVRKFPPATVMTIEADGWKRQHAYWDLRFERAPEDETCDVGQWEERVLDTLRLAVRRRQIADVPVGVLLSGGLDSSLVVGLLAEEGQKDLNTFSIGFESVGEESGDEFHYSDIVAKRFGTKHHKIFVRSDTALPALRDCVAAMAEPMVSHDTVAFFLLSREVANHVKVVQSGQGADEVFAGYHWYPPLQGSNDPVSDYARVFFDRDHGEFLFAVDPGYVHEDHSRQFVEEHFARAGAKAPLDKALRLDTTVMLADDPVKRVDNMTMAWGLEARVPFLDHQLVELAAAIPAQCKVDGGGKRVLKDAARRVLPADIIDRPKGYFPVPALKYLRGRYLDLVRDVLATPAARARGLFRREYVENLLARPDAHITPLRGSKLWQIGLLEMWLQTHCV